MRRYAIAVALLWSALGCASGPNEHQSKITLRGHLPAAAVPRSVAGGAALTTLAGATRVAVIYVSGSPEVFPIVNGAFSISVGRNSPAGLVFADAAGSPVGYLSLGNGIATLPLTAASDTLTLIDFQALASNGAIVTPAHNPMGVELPLSPADIAALAQVNAYFAAVVQNADADGDGQVDALSGRLYWLSPLFFFNGGSFTGSATAATTLPVNLNCSRLVLWAFDPSPPPAATIQFPTGATDGGLAGPIGGGLVTYGTSRCEQAPPPGGQYRVSYGTKLLTFTLPDPAATLAQIIVPMPTVVLAAGTVTGIDWTYRTSSDPTPVDPALLLDQPLLDIKGYDLLGANVMLWQSGENRTILPPGTTHVDLSTPQVWSRVTEVDMGYIDSYHNEVDFQFYQPSAAP